MKQSFPHRYRGSRAARAGMIMLTLLGATALTGLAQQTDQAWSDFRNLIYTPSPPPTSPRKQAASVSFYSGNVGAVGRAPSAAGVFLMRSVIGAPLEGRLFFDIQVGEMVTADLPGVDYSKTPVIDSPLRAFYVPDYTWTDGTVTHTGAVFATSPGYVQIQWRSSSNALITPARRYLVSPVHGWPTEPVAVYHTHASTEQQKVDYGTDPPPPPSTKAPVVDIPLSYNVTIHYSEAVPDQTYLRRLSDGRIYAQVRTGFVFLEYRGSGISNPPVRLELVEVRAPQPLGGLAAATSVNVGERLKPNVPEPTAPQLSGKPLVTLGLGTALPAVNRLAYQHNEAASPQFGQVYSIRPHSGAAVDETTGGIVEIYWKKRTVLPNVEWPYDLVWYKSSWPQNDPSKHQRYVRGTPSSILGPDVEIPSTLNAEVMPHFDPAPTDPQLGGGRFTAKSPGWSLLKYNPVVNGARNVSFQVVRSVSHADNILFDLATSDRPVGSEITDPYHAGPRPGYIHRPVGTHYDWEAYDRLFDGDAQPDIAETYPDAPGARVQTNQIIPVNEGTLEVWWSNLATEPNTGQTVQWPSLVKRYRSVWPTATPEIIVASQIGTGVVDPATYRNFRLYFQNDPSGNGFNPNDEHAFVTSLAQGRSIFALRDDLARASTSQPFVLAKHQNAAGDKWIYRLWKVLAEKPGSILFNDSIGSPEHRQRYQGRAGNFIQPIFPIADLPYQQRNFGFSGPKWRDRKGNWWAMAAGSDGGTAAIEMQFYYPAQESFFFPSDYTLSYLPQADRRPRPADPIPLLDRRPNGTPGTPTNVRFTISWPDDVPELRVGETLVDAKRGLPDIGNRDSVQVIYQQSVANGTGESVQVMDWAKAREVQLDSIPDDMDTVDQGGLKWFPKLPPHLFSRLSYDPVNKRLRLRGTIIRPALGDPYLLPNIVTERERVHYLSNPAVVGSDATFRGALSSLAAAASEPIVLRPGDSDFDSIALTAGFAKGLGYVTLAFENEPALSSEATPVALEVIRVTCPLYRGSVRPVMAESPFDEKITMRYDGELAGKSDQYEFQWKTIPDLESGVEPSSPPGQWNDFSSGFGMNDVTIAGPGLFTLSDNWFACRYRPVVPAGTLACGTEWSEWTPPALAQGWIKRVIAGINPFEQKYKDLADPTKLGVDTIVSMLSQAGKRWEGDVPLTAAAAVNLGLIEVYETVLRRGIDFSIEATPPFDYGPANNALLLAAGRLADLYMLLGNEAYADAADPTIAFGVDGADYQQAVSTIHCFQNLAGGSTLMEEELSLLRGRDNRFLPNVRKGPVYNRLGWNFTGSDGEVAYALNYGIRDHNGGGGIDESDARIDYPQGHGDAWGHYLMAIKNYYRLLRNVRYTWIPRAETITIGGTDVSVDYLDERKFARAAAAKARAGAEIVGLTYRSSYTENPDDQWRGYKDSDGDRAWGLAEWGSRAGHGCYLDWVVGNALIPETDDLRTGIAKIDRTTVTELREVSSTISQIQSEVDKADLGLNPLGLAKNVLPFDINPGLLDGGKGKGHFEQIYDRAVQAMNNAITVFNNANGSSQRLRQQSDTQEKFRQQATEREQDFKSRLIEIFGYPYPEDIGGAGKYPAGYDGADIYHHMYVDPMELVGEPNQPVDTFQVTYTEPTVAANGALTNQSRTVTYHLSRNGYGLVKPSEWTGQRRAPGELQMTRSDLIQAKGRFDRALLEYDNLLARIEEQAALMAAQYALNAEEIRVQYGSLGTQIRLNDRIAASRERQLQFRTAGRVATEVANATAEALPQSLIAGFANGGDFTSPLRSAIRLAGTVINEINSQKADRESLAELDYQQAKEVAQSQTSIALAASRNDFAVTQQLAQIRDLIRQEATQRLEIHNLQEAIQQASGRYLATLARGQRLQDEWLRFRKVTAADTQNLRYKDMAFRIFRNDALQKYRAQFDLASSYVYMAARAYDYETNLLGSDGRGPGQDFLTSIVRTRAIGNIQNGQPQTGGGFGDGGLADPMARMVNNWGVLKNQLGFNSPQNESNRFSLRRELFRIPASGADNDLLWRKTLRSLVVPNVLAMPEFQRFCIPFTPANPTEPAIVIPFGTNINFGLNYFGWPAGGGDSSYDSTNFATKIHSAGIWFTNYNATSLGNNPRVYLVPVGDDVMRSPSGNRSATREWRILDQVLPVPFAIGESSVRNNPSWIPANDGLVGNPVQIRRYSSLRAYHDSGSFNVNEVSTDTRLVGRSVWNTRWLLVIPAGTLLNDRGEALDRFIDGSLSGGERNGQGVKDILLLFRTFAHSGN